MQVISQIARARKAVAQAREEGRTIGLVPTMGALHRGHLSLVGLAQKEAGYVVVSIFVNPTQFGPNEDFNRYPRPIEDDNLACRRQGVDLLFNPEPAEMYPSGYCTHVEVTGLQNGLCGASRPGHFRGVATVVLKLLNIIQPDFAYFGQKDAQQVRIIQQMVADLDLATTIRVGPIVREPDGLALSSRNQYLDPTQRKNAPVLWEALKAARDRVQEGERDAEVLRRLLVQRIEATPGAVLDYAAVVDARSLGPIERLEGPTLLALAVKFGSTRLIDNVQVNPERRQ
jgi:pantoate--beta-alanine ligase